MDVAMGRGADGAEEPRRSGRLAAGGGPPDRCPRGHIELAAVQQTCGPTCVGVQAAAHAVAQGASRRACSRWPRTTTRGPPSSALFGSDLLKRLQVPCPSVRSIVVVVSPGQGSELVEWYPGSWVGEEGLQPGQTLNPSSAAAVTPRPGATRTRSKGR